MKRIGFFSAEDEAGFLSDHEEGSYVLYDEAQAAIDELVGMLEDVKSCIKHRKIQKHLPCNLLKDVCGMINKYRKEQ